MIQLPIPENFDNFSDWANNVCLQDPSAPLATTEDWREWGYTVGLIGLFPGYINPDVYDDWKDWASKLIENDGTL